jgi:chromosome segregation ATPase
MTQDLKKLNKQLEKVEKQLNTCRTSVMQDGWQTQKFARKSRKWDYYATKKHEINLRINEIEAELKINTEGHIIRLPEESSFNTDQWYT